MFVKSVAIIR